MKHIILTLCALLVCTAASAQEMMRYGVGLGLGYSVKSGLAIQGDLWLGNFYLGLGSDIGKLDNVIGREYATINPGDPVVREDRYSTGSYIGSSVNIDAGYRASKYITVGASVGWYQNKEYINCYDEHNILGDNGYYNVVSSEEKVIGYGAFITAHYPIGKFAPYVRLSYMSAAGASVGVGISYHFQLERSYNPYLY